MTISCFVFIMIPKLFERGVHWVKSHYVYRNLPNKFFGCNLCTCNENSDISIKNLHTEDSNGTMKTEAEKGINKANDNLSKNELPEEPTTCCMSGCANCVWLEYAEKMNEYFKDGGDKAIKEINEKVNDPNIRAFLLQELRMKKL